MESDLMRFRKLYGLKLVHRNAASGKRNESAAEHSWSCMLLADYFLGRMKIKIDRMKVYQMLLYHDVVEIESGDMPILMREKRKTKEIEEMAAIRKISKELPENVGGRIESLFSEFEECKTKEARFAKAIDGLDAIIHELDYRNDWKNWDERILREMYEKRFVDFPEMMDAFEESIAFLYQKGWFRK